MRPFLPRALLALLLAIPFAAAAQGFDLFSPAAAETAFLEARDVSHVEAPVVADGKLRVASGPWSTSTPTDAWVDFYADWCVSCHVIEREVFGDPRVAARLARMQVLRPDVTANDVQARQLMRDWAVVGPPTLLLVAPDGRERRALRTVGEISATQFLDRLEQAGAGQEA